MLGEPSISDATPFPFVLGEPDQEKNSNSTPFSLGLRTFGLLGLRTFGLLRWPTVLTRDALSSLFMEPDSGTAAFSQAVLQCSRDERETLFYPNPGESRRNGAQVYERERVLRLGIQ
jgi:hypothetical protein